MKRIGSKYTMIFGIIVFIVGSMLSGASFTFPMLVASRLVQGLGAYHDDDGEYYSEDCI